MHETFFKEGEHATINDTNEVCIILEQRPVGLTMFYVVEDENGGRRRVIAHTRLRPAPAKAAH